MSASVKNSINASRKVSDREATYLFQKVIGKRYSTGELKLKQLKPMHKNIIALHLQGYRAPEIVSLMTSAGHEMDQQLVYRTLRSPKAQEIIQEFQEGYDLELKGLVGNALEALQKAMRNGGAEAVSAADKVLKANRKYEGVDGRATAEDNIQRLLELAREQNVTIRDIAANRQRPQVIDMTAKEVEDGSGG